MGIKTLQGGKWGKGERMAQLYWFLSTHTVLHLGLDDFVPVVLLSPQISWIPLISNHLPLILRSELKWKVLSVCGHPSFVVVSWLMYTLYMQLLPFLHDFSQPAISTSFWCADIHPLEQMTQMLALCYLKNGFSNLMLTHILSNSHI